jgi:hypothetical protein
MRHMPCEFPAEVGFGTENDAIAELPVEADLRSEDGAVKLQVRGRS